MVIIAINRFMMSVLKTLSYPDINVKKNYKLDRHIDRITRPPFKTLFNIWDHKVESEGRDIPVRVFLPDEAKSTEILLFFHGGGWVSGDIESYTNTCGLLARETGRRVLSVDYRLAPEFPFPSGLEDCYAVARDLHESCCLLGIGWEEVTLIGDSAGGNLAAATSILAKERGEFSVERQILIYPSTSNDHSDKSVHKSVSEYSRDYLLTSKKIRDYIELYLSKPEDYENYLFAPLLCPNLSGQPDTLIITAEYDPLRDEGEAFAERLREAGNTVYLKRIPDALHGFFNLPLIFDSVRECYKHINNFLSKVDLGENEDEMEPAR